MTIYPTKRFAMMMDVNGPQPSYAPNPEADPLQAYSTFLHETEAAALAEIASDAESRLADLEGEDLEDGEDIEDYADEGIWVEPCVVHEDGSIEFESFTMTREQVFAKHGVDDIVPPKP